MRDFELFCCKRDDLTQRLYPILHPVSADLIVTLVRYHTQCHTLYRYTDAQRQVQFYIQRS